MDEKAKNPLLRSGPLQIVAAKNVLATPFTHDETGQTSGALYDESGKKIPISERPPGKGGDRYVPRNPDTLAFEKPNRVLNGDSVYLGNFMSAHYGHFLLETLSTFWALSYLAKPTQYVFHPFIFGVVMPQFAKDYLSAFGIDPDDVVIVTEKTLLEKVTIPARLHYINVSAHERMKDVYSNILSSFSSSLDPPDRIYLSRTRVRPHNRRIPNECEIEELFKETGFAVIHPQELSTSEQLSFYRKSKVIAGCSGSQLHNIVFSQPGSLFVEVLDHRNPDRPNRSQRICNALGQADYKPIPAGASTGDHAVDLEKISDAIRSIGLRSRQV